MQLPAFLRSSPVKTMCAGRGFARSRVKSGLGRPVIVDRTTTTREREVMHRRAALRASRQRIMHAGRVR